MESQGDSSDFAESNDLKNGLPRGYASRNDGFPPAVFARRQLAEVIYSLTVFARKSARTDEAIHRDNPLVENMELQGDSSDFAESNDLKNGLPRGYASRNDGIKAIPLPLTVFARQA